MKIKSLIATLIIAAIFVAGCKGVSNLTTFVKCDFDFVNVDNVKVADINFSQKKKYSDFSIIDAAKLVKALTNKNFNLDLTVNVKAKNPNQRKAAIGGFDYILWIDDVKTLAGTMNQPFEIEPNESIVMPMNFTIDLLEVLKGESRDKILSFGCGLATHNADASRVKLSLKPYFNNGTQITKFPTYITIGGDKIMPSNY